MRLELHVWLRHRHYTISFEGGWFRGNEFCLFDFRLLNIYDGGMIIIALQIAKFIIGINATEVE